MTSVTYKVMQESPNSPREKLIAEISDTATLNTYSLVLSATNITHRIEYISPTQIAIYVSTAQAEKALYELATFDNENANWPEAPPKQTFEPTFLGMGIVIVGCLSAVYFHTGQWAENSLWFLKGAGDSDKILNHSEYFRIITSLTLHADLVHLLSNCILGGIVIHYYLLLMGNGLGLTMLTVTACFATYINVISHGPGHHFVGFSTAIFAVIGMLCTISFTYKTQKRGSLLVLPVMAGLALLAFLGSGGARTDLGAHLFGLLCGLLGGNVVRLPQFKTLRDSFFVQTISAILIFALYIYCWQLAL